MCRDERIGNGRGSARAVSSTFETFFEQQYSALVKLAYLLSCDPVEAREIAQEAMARSLR